MLMRQLNKVREKLKRGERVLGTAVYSNSANMVEAAGFSGIDFIRIDNEHSWRRDESMDAMIKAAIIADVVSIVRVDRDDPFLIRKVLELGAGGVVVPDVTTAAYAREVVASAKFPPHGTRGYGSLCLSGEWGRRSREEWVEWSNTQPLIGVMIENLAAMTEIDDILAIDGLDFVIFGPSDYYMSLPGDDRDAKGQAVREGLAHTVATARKYGKYVLCGTSMEDNDIQAKIDAGVDMLCFAHDVDLFRIALEQKVARFGANS